MRSTSGEYYPALDHVRALAAFLVFFWHFNFPNDGTVSPDPVFPLSFFFEGHTGVAIFMTLSGYLFAKLLDGRRIFYGTFLWNRFLRLAPLLFLALALHVLQQWHQGTLTREFLEDIWLGFFLSTLPGGAWSVAVEIHFYLLLPLLLWLARRSLALFAAALILAFLLRWILLLETGEIRNLAYWTLIGRFDQFLLGILGFYLRGQMKGRGAAAGAIALGLLALWHLFGRTGGFHHGPEAAWLVVPAIEGFAYAALIAWYDQVPMQRSNPASRFAAWVGRLSYSIYLLHFFLVFEAARLIGERVPGFSDPFLRLPAALFCFLLLLPLFAVTYRLIERPWLKYRRPYLRRASPRDQGLQAPVGDR